MVPGELLIDVLATIDQFRRRLYVLNGSTDTDETDAIGKSLFELFTRFFKPLFGPMDYWNESGDAPNVLWQAIEDSSEELTAEWFARSFDKALAAAGITDYGRPFHDMRHAALTNLAAAGASPIAVMATAGDPSMSTTNRYVHLAGVVFRDDAGALELRLLGGELSTHLVSPEPVSPDLERLEQAVSASDD